MGVARCLPNEIRLFFINRRVFLISFLLLEPITRFYKRESSTDYDI